MEWQKVAPTNNNTTFVYVGIVRQIASGLTAACIAEDGDGPDRPDALEEFDAHLWSVVANKTASVNALLMKVSFRATDIRCKDSIAAADYCTCSHVLKRIPLTLRYKTSENSVCVHILLHPSYKSTDVGVPPAEIDHGLNFCDHNCGDKVRYYRVTSTLRPVTEFYETREILRDSRN
jgi:hypothetical protein